MDFWARRTPGIVVVGSVVFALLALLLVNLLAAVLSRNSLAWSIGANLLALLFATVLTTRLVDRVGLVTVGLGWGKFAWREIARGGALGGGLALATVAIIAVVALLTGGDVALELRGISSLGWCGSLLLIGGHAAAEELLYRGYLFQRFDELAGSAFATLASVGLFVLAHGGNPSVTPLGLVSIGAGGLLFSLLLLRTGSLWSASVCHALWNIVLGPICGLPISGVLPYNESLLSLKIDGATALTGGAFGPEGSIVAVLVVLAGCFVVVRMRAFDTQPERFARRFSQLQGRAATGTG